MWGQILDDGWHLILPTLALGLTGFAGKQRLMRGQLLDVAARLDPNSTDSPVCRTIE